MANALSARNRILTGFLSIDLWDSNEHSDPKSTIPISEDQLKAAPSPLESKGLLSSQQPYGMLVILLIFSGVVT